MTFIKPALPLWRNGSGARELSRVDAGNQESSGPEFRRGQEPTIRKEREGWGSHWCGRVGGRLGQPPRACKIADASRL